MALRVLLLVILKDIVCWRSICVEGVTFSLRGNDSIPTDGSGRVLITDINPNGHNDEDALICRSEIDTFTSNGGDWFLDPTERSTDEGDRLDSSNPRGWNRNRGLDSGHRLVRLRRGSATAEEGVFTCHIAGDNNTHRALGIYYPISSVTASIDVVSGRLGTFRVRCTSSGGRALNMSVTGPGGFSEDLDNIQAVGTTQRMGSDRFSGSIDIIPPGGSDGQVYQCTASNGVPPDPTDTVELRVANPPTISSLQQLSPTSVRVTWSQPPGGATVTGYIVHYSNGGPDMMRTVSPSSTTTDIPGLTNGATYTISVEATSQHLSGESEEMIITLQPPPPPPVDVMVDGVDDTSVTVSWEAVNDADRYTVTFTKTTTTETQQGVCINARHVVSVPVDAPSTSTSGISASIDVGQMLAADETTMLRAYTTYSITVVAVNDVTGSSGDSEAITVTTAQIGATAAPDNVRATVVSSTVISVQWDGPEPCRHANGRIVLYRIQYTEVASGVVQSKDEAGDWNVVGVETSLTGLTPSTSYSIQLAAVNEEDEVGVYSDPLTRRTLLTQPAVTVISTTATSISLSWTSAGSEVDRYKVMWTSVECPDDVDEGSATITDVTETSYIIDGLREGTSYTITVSATKSASTSPSDPVTRATGELAPSAAPTSVRTYSDSSSSITVQWGMVPCIHRNGDITGYSVRYGEVGSGSTQTVSVSGGDTSQTTISGLRPSRTYLIQVAARNTAGIELYSDSTYQLTLVEAPSITVVLTSVTPNTIPLTWTSAGSVVNSYGVQWTYDGECSEVMGGSAIVTGTMTGYTIEGLEEYITYSITVNATNNVSSEDSEVATGMTSEAAPSGPPTSVSGTSTSTTITVQWGAVDCIHRNGDITGYSVRYREMGSGSTQTVNVSGYSYTISNLTSSTTYSIQVTAENSVGSGVYSDHLIVHTKSVYLRLNDVIIPNHGYVVISDIGSTDDTALICHTNRPATLKNINGPHSGGDWFAPDDTRVYGDDVPGFKRNRGPMMVRLYRNTTTGTPSEGIYHCLVDDRTDIEQMVYVGLYSNGKGNVTIQSNVVFTVDSDLNGASPQFTLTCISTGGPATTVTWTRNLNNVTEGAETVLDNRVTAQYNHTLTVTGRLGGLYTCTVANNKSSEDSAQLKVEVASPLNSVTVTASRNTVTVTWSVSTSGDDVTGYLVYYHHPNYNTTIGSQNVHSDIFIENSASQQVYSVSVQAQSIHIPSEVLGPVTVRVPSHVQEHLVEGLIDGSLNISWERPAQPNDYTLNYTVSITNISTGTELNRTVLTEKTQIIVTLPHTPLKGVPFNVTVFATNGKGKGGSVSKVAYVEEDVPQPPSDVVVERVNATHMEVRWTALSPVEARGHITHYTISYWPASNSEPVTSITVHNTTSTSYRVLIGGLLSGEAYVVEVSASTAAGDGDKAEVTLEKESDSLAALVAGAIVAVIIVIIIIIIIIIITASIPFILRRRRVSRRSMKLGSKPLPPLKSLEEREEVEMKGLVTSTEEDKDEYFEDSFNIVTAHQDIPEADFPDHVREMHQDRDHKFELEYKCLEKLPQPASEVARLSCNTPHNRFKNIYPYDSTRVRLTRDPAVEGSDYINASFIDGYPDRKHAYIAAQGPTEQTVDRFWQMVWENQLTTIVMLTRCVEDGKVKCEQYWPDQVNSTVTMGSKFTVTLTSFVPSAEYQVRKLLLRSVSEPERELTVTHMYYTAWPDHGVPRNAMSVISFIHRVRKEHPACLDLPLLVHCSAGVGRTGTFILLDSVMQQIKREGTLSVFNMLKNVRGQRMKLVQTQVQYVFIHDSLSELVVCGETEIVAADIRIKMNHLRRRVVGDMTTTGFQKQFQTLEKVSAQYKASYQEAEARYNASKNRFPDKLPNELARVRLHHSPQSGSDYINASFIDGYKHLGAYVATQGPLPGTVEAFWRMVWEHHCSCVVMLCEEMENGEESCHCFWPQGSGGAGEDGAGEVYGKLAVSVKRVNSHGDMTERRLDVEERGKKAPHRVVTLLQMTGWPPQGLPHPSAMLALVDLLSKAQRSSPSKHTIVMCSDGVGRTGTFICLHSQLERLKTEGVVDFFQAVKSARIQRAGLVPDAAHYAFCHDVIASYVDSFETYANFKEVV